MAQLDVVSYHFSNVTKDNKASLRTAGLWAEVLSP
jgi:hypothetical protein